VSSSDSNVPEDAWARHYRLASERRRARGWHRRDEARPRTRRAPARLWLYAGVGAIFVALTVAALVLRP
jgi:hypothetical protein